MGRLFDITELEAGVFSEDELQAIETYAEEELAEENVLMERKENSSEDEDFLLPEDEAGFLESDDGEDFPALELELSLENGQMLTCQVIGVFVEGEKEYIALHPKGDEDDSLIHLMILTQGEDDSICLQAIEDEAELEAAALAFHRFMDDERLEFDEEVVLEETEDF